MKRMLSLLLTIAMLLPICISTPATQITAQAAGKKLIALTFDDGPGPYTNRLLDGLKKQNVKATFFMLGSRAEAYPEVAKRVYQEGHQVASHTYDHPDLTSLSNSSVQNQVWTTSDILHKTTGASDFYVRPPYGSVNSRVQSLIAAPLIYWSVDTRDWEVLNSAKVTANILADSYDGAIVLMHDIHSTTIDGVLNAISTLKDRGYEFVTVRELYRRRGITPKNGEIYYSCKANGKDTGAATAPKITTTEQSDGLKVTLTAQSGSTIYYTTDGSDPLTKGKKYTGAFTTGTPCTIRALAAFHLNGDRSDIAELKITTPTAKAPNLTIEDGVLTLSGGSDSTAIYYTTDGTTATTNALRYTAPVQLTPGTVVSAVCGGKGYLTSREVRATYSDNENVLRDVYPNQWYYQSIDKLLTAGVMSGIGNQYFEPRAEITRGQLVTILYNYAGRPETDESTLPFDDVAVTDYYAKAVSWAYAQGIVSGHSDTTFAPKDPILRQEMSQILSAYLRAAGDDTDTAETTLSYTDCDRISDWAEDAVKHVTALGLFSGDEKGNFNPRDTATRAEAASVVCKMIELS